MHATLSRRASLTGALLLLFFCCDNASAQQPNNPTRCQLIPLPGHQLSFQVEGVEKTRWHYGKEYPRPFFYPLNGPSGASLTRMGHPGASNHDHHRSVWFAHHAVEGHDFWSDNTPTQVRQNRWFAYADGPTEAVMASAATWVAADGSVVMEQETVAALIPLANQEHALELQITLRPPAKSPSVELDKTNFGFLAVRVAKSISVHFGGGQLTNSAGSVGEKAIFGKQAKWMDYSGPVAVGQGADRRMVTEGITYFDHPTNPRYPTHWHVRSDGWMGASFCMQQAYTITAEQPLVLRYLLHAHAGAYDPAKAARTQEAFVQRAGFSVSKSSKPHLQHEVKRSE